MDELLPHAGIDVLKHRDVMLSCINTINDGNADYAIRIAMAMTALFAGEGVTTRRLADFLPAYSGADTAESHEHSLWDVAERLGVNAHTWAELLNSPVFRLKRDEPVPVTRLLSWLGYFWWEFTRDITEYRFVGFCQRCGKVIAGGHMDRKFCKRDENLDCYRAAEAVRKRMDRRGKRAADKGA